MKLSESLYWDAGHARDRGEIQRAYILEAASDRAFAAEQEAEGPPPKYENPRYWDEREAEGLRELIVTEDYPDLRTRTIP